MSLEKAGAVDQATLERLGVDTAAVMLEATALLLRQESVGDLLRVGLERIARMVQADAAMLHLESDAAQHLESDAAQHLEPHSAQVFTLREAYNLAPFPRPHLIHDTDPQGSLPLLSRGHWMIWDYPNDWSGPPEQRYDRIAGVRQAAVFGLRDGSHLLGYVTLLFHAPRRFDAHSQALGGLGAIWGLQLHRLTQLAEKERARERLALLDQAFKGLFASNPMPMWVFDLETLGFLEVNDAAIAHYGYSRAEFLVLRITDIVLESDAPRLLEALASRSITSGSERLWQHRLKNGSVIEVSATSHDMVFAGRAALLVVLEDITERLASDQALKTSERMYRLLAENSTNLISKFDADWNCLYISPAVRGLLGFEPETLRTMPLTKSVHPDDQDAMLQRLIAASESGQTLVTLEYRALRIDGSYTWLESSFKLIRDAVSGDLLEVQVSSRDISERRRVNDELYRRAYVDALTGLPNRARFLDQLEAAMSNPQAGVALALVDLDHIKRINDSLGHSAGDEVLCQLAQRLQLKLTSERCTVCRMGGDEFAVVWRDTSSDQLEALGADLQAALSGPVVVEGLTLFISASIGLSHCPTDAVSVRQLLRFADGSLYRAKLRGGDTFVCFTPDIASEAMERLLIEQELRRAGAEELFSLVYQPINDLKSGLVQSFEALLRWRHPTLGVVSPAKFIPIAEESGLIASIGAWVMEHACTEVAAWRVGGQPARLSVNVSMRQFAQPDFVAQVADILERTGFAPERLTIELTESALMSDAEHVMPQLFELRDLGVRLSIDDFGVGYSNFSYLHRMPVTQLKIDKSFTDQLETSVSTRALVSGMISLAHALKLTVIAEGVERDTQRALIQSFGCDQAQGYLYHKPLEPLEIRQRLLNRSSHDAHQ